MQPIIHSFTIEEYQHFLDSHPEPSNQRYELVKGVIYDLPPIGAEHAYTVIVLNKLLGKMIDDTDLLHVHNPIQLEDSQPQPDLVVIKRDERLRLTLPMPQACHLVIEVADRSVRYDREIKVSLYA